MAIGRSGMVVVLFALAGLTSFAPTSAGAQSYGSGLANRSGGANGTGQANESGLAVPRFVSLKSDRVNIRSGPGTNYRILWVFRRAGLPVEVLKEFQGWRQIRDAEGGTGWVLGALLSGRRTALVLPWERSTGVKTQTNLRAAGAVSSRTLAFIQAGVLASVLKCSGKWCKISVSDVRGFIEQKKLWGVYPNEQLK